MNIRHVQPKKLPPAKVYVYFCETCGNPFLADLKSTISSECPYCPYVEGRTMVARYELLPGTPKRGRR